MQLKYETKTIYVHKQLNIKTIIKKKSKYKRIIQI